MELIVIDEHKCTNCGLCSKACPVGIIAIQDGFPTTVEKIAKGCITCGHCVAVCPSAALSHSRMKPEECEPLALDWRPAPDQMEQLIKGRRSVRNFRAEQVDSTVLARLIEIARYAPTGMNSQSVHWKVVLDDQEVQWLSLAVVEWLRTLEGDGLYGAKGMLKAWTMGRDPVLRKAPNLIIAHGAADDPIVSSSSIIALTTLELAAISFGLGTCWAGFLHQAANSSAGVATALGLPPGHRMCGGLMIGYPEFPYARIPTRNPAPVIWGVIS